MTAPRVAAVVLAAGASRRFGRPKLLVPWAGGTVLSASVLPFLEAGCDPVVVVVGPEVAGAAHEEAGLPTGEPRLVVVPNPDRDEGLSSSIRRGIAACAGAAGAFLALADHVGLDAARVRALVAAWTPAAPLALPVHEGRGGHPVLFAHALFPELLALTGDVGARDVVRRHGNAAVRVPLLPLRDVDTEDEYRAAIEGRPVPHSGLLLP